MAPVRRRSWLFDANLDAVEENNNFEPNAAGCVRVRVCVCVMYVFTEDELVSLS